MWWPSSHSFATPSLFKRSTLVAQTVRSLPTSRRARFNFWVRKMPWKREQQPTAVFLPREFHAQKSLEGYSPRGHRVSDTTTQPTLFIYFALFNYRGLEYFTSTPRASCPVLYILRQASSTFKRFTRKKVLCMRFTPILPILMFFFPFWNSSLLLLPVPWWGTHVHPWLIHANVWQKPPPHC